MPLFFETVLALAPLPAATLLATTLVATPPPLLLRELLLPEGTTDGTPDDVVATDAVDEVSLNVFMRNSWWRAVGVKGVVCSATNSCWRATVDDSVLCCWCKAAFRLMEEAYAAELADEARDSIARSCLRAS